MHKVWGNTEKILHRPDLHLHRLDIEAGGYCSRHKHGGRFNWFFVESGNLLVETWPDGPCEAVDTEHLLPGDVLVVQPGMIHRFRAATDVVCFEAYWSEVDDSDIERLDTGGMRDSGCLI